MNPRIIVVLLVVALLLGIGSFFLLGKTPPPVDTGAAEDLFGFVVQRVDRISVTRGRDPLYELEKGAAGWVFRSPALGEADAGKVLRLLSDLRFEAKIKGDLGRGEIALEQYGLAKPRLVVTIHEPGSTITLEIGDPNSTKDGIYVRFPGTKRVVVTTPIVGARLSVVPDTFRPSEGETVGPTFGR